VTLLVSKTLCPGKFLSWWEAMSAQSSRLLPRATARPERCWSTAWSPNIHASVLPAISGLNAVEQRQAVGIVETWSVAACVSAADRAVKASNVTLVRVHMAFGIGGKCYMVVTGDISDVENAVAVASESAGEKGLLVYRSVIPRPHEAMWRQIVEG
jgi:ethanolamine utilization microcompartment shell protein EutS